LSLWATRAATKPSTCITFFPRYVAALAPHVAHHCTSPQSLSLHTFHVVIKHRKAFMNVEVAGKQKVLHFGTAHAISTLRHVISCMFSAQASVKSRPSVLWCYKKELGFSSHKQKRMKQLKKMASRAGTEVITHTYTHAQMWLSVNFFVNLYICMLPDFRSSYMFAVLVHTHTHTHTHTHVCVCVFCDSHIKINMHTHLQTLHSQHISHD
jgi:hypothetical protein